MTNTPLSKRILTQFSRSVFIVALFAMSPWVVMDRAPYAYVVAGLSVLVGIYLIRTNREEYELGLLLAAGVAAITVFIVPEFEGGRHGGYLNNPNITGSVLAMFIVLAFMRRRWAFVALLAAAMAMGRSIGAFMGIGAAIGYLLLTNARILGWIKRHKWQTALGILAGVILLVGGLWYMFQVRDWWSDRLDFYALTLKMIQSAPLTGHGPGSFRLNFFVISLTPRSFHGDLHPHAHNLYLHLGAELGLLAPLAVILLGAWLFMKGDRTARAILIVMAVHSLVDSTLLYPSVDYSLLMLMLPSLLLRESVPRPTAQAAEPAPKPSHSQTAR